MKASVRLVLCVVAVALPSAASPGPARVTPDGWGAIKIGMRESAVAKIARLKPPDPEDLKPAWNDDYRACHQTELRDWPGVSLMFETGKLTRVEIYGASKVRSPSGVAIGAGEATVLKAHRDKPTVTTAEYDDEPAHSLLYWTAPGKRGVRYLTDEHRRVVAIFAGTASIQYIEGCL